MNDKDNEKKGWLAGIGNMISGGWGKAKAEIGEAAADLSVAGLGKVVNSNEGQKVGSMLISHAIKESVGEIKNNAGSLVKEGKSLLKKDESNPNASSYEIIRASLRPPEGEDGLLKRVFKDVAAHVINAGAGIAGWVGATFVNKIFTPKDQVVAADVKSIFVSFMSKIFGGEKNKQVPTPIPVPAA